jgi:hypothetical protein
VGQRQLSLVTAWGYWEHLQGWSTVDGRPWLNS